MVFFITLMLSLLYGLLGRLRLELWLLRFEENSALDAYVAAFSTALNPDHRDGDDEALGELHAKTLALRDAHDACKRGWIGLTNGARLAREWRLAERPWEPEAETTALAESRVRRLSGLSNRASDCGATARDQEAATFAGQTLEALSRSVDRLAQLSAALPGWKARGRDGRSRR